MRFFGSWDTGAKPLININSGKLANLREPDVSERASRLSFAYLAGGSPALP
jgi:hypothetical protein